MKSDLYRLLETGWFCQAVSPGEWSDVASSNCAVFHVSSPYSACMLISFWDRILTLLIHAHLTCFLVGSWLWKKSTSPLYLPFITIIKPELSTHIDLNAMKVGLIKKRKESVKNQIQGMKKVWFLPFFYSPTPATCLQQRAVCPRKRRVFHIRLALQWTSAIWFSCWYSCSRGDGAI